MDLPAMRCDIGCGKCCGPVGASPAEFEQISEYVRANGITPLRQGKTCPMFQAGGCAIYPVRPAVCRLYGHVPEMRCPIGYNVNIPATAAERILTRYARTMPPGPRFLHALAYSEAETLQILRDTIEHAADPAADVEVIWK